MAVAQKKKKRMGKGKGLQALIVCFRYSHSTNTLCVQRDVMYAEIPQEVIQQVDPLLQVYRVYVISGFRVNPAKPSYKPFNGHLMIEFSEYTTTKLADNPPETFPRYVYTLTAFD